MYIIQDMRLTFVLLDTKLNGCEGKCFSRFFILCSAIALHYYTDAPVRKCQDVRVKGTHVDNFQRFINPFATGNTLGCG